jgi:hypothetical protein
MAETSTDNPQPTPGPAPREQPETQRPKREILGPKGLVVMVVAILLFTAVSIVIEVTNNLGTRYRATVDLGDPIRDDAIEVIFHVRNTGSRAGRPDVCDATLYDIRGARVGTSSIRLREPIQPGDTFTGTAVGVVAGAPVNGSVDCRSLSPG